MNNKVKHEFYHATLQSKIYLSFLSIIFKDEKCSALFLTVPSHRTTFLANKGSMYKKSMHPGTDFEEIEYKMKVIVEFLTDGLAMLNPTHVSCNNIHI